MAKWTPSNTTTYYWANGSQVQQNKGAPSIWTDQSGNGRVVQRPSQAAAPTLLTADLNGHDVLEFDGTNDCLQSDDASEFNFESSDFAVLPFTKGLVTTRCKLLLTWGVPTRMGTASTTFISGA